MMEVRINNTGPTQSPTTEETAKMEKPLTCAEIGVRFIPQSNGGVIIETSTTSTNLSSEPAVDAFIAELGEAGAQARRMFVAEHEKSRK